MEGLLGQAAVGQPDLGVTDRVEPEGRVELGPQARRQRSDLGRGFGFAPPDGIGDLARPKNRRATGGEPCLQLARGEPGDARCGGRWSRCECPGRLDDGQRGLDFSHAQSLGPRLRDDERHGSGPGASSVESKCPQ